LRGMEREKVQKADLKVPRGGAGPTLKNQTWGDEKRQEKKEKEKSLKRTSRNGWMGKKNLSGHLTPRKKREDCRGLRAEEMFVEDHLGGKSQYVPH